MLKQHKYKNNRERLMDTRPVVYKLIMEYEAELKNYLHKKIGDYGLAKEAFQETVLRVLTHFDELKKQENFRAWIFIIASNVCNTIQKHIRNDQKKYKGYYEQCNAQISFHNHNFHLAEKMICEEDILIIQNVLISFTEEDQEIFHNFYVDHKSISELAIEHGISERTVKRRLAKIRESIRSKMK
jgi:RNA polymerase sigma factor (sigma-70 family)